MHLIYRVFGTNWLVESSMMEEIKILEMKKKDLIFQIMNNYLWASL